MNADIKTIYSLYNQCEQKVCTDTRKIIPGSIFFALKGQNFDANLFVEDALNKGCAYAITDSPEMAAKSERCILVKDVLEILQQLAKYHRQQLNPVVIGITGSNGKTTTKELITKVLQKKYHVLSTPGNFNNHIGLPLTLLQLKKEHQIAVIEMGANHPGEIKELCEIALPNYAVITSIGKEHLEGFRNIENVKKTNGELYEYVLKNNGKVFLHINNKDLIDILDNLNVSYIKEIERFILYTDNPSCPYSDEQKQTTIVAGKYEDNHEDIFVRFRWFLNKENIWEPFNQGNYIGKKIKDDVIQSRPLIKTHLLAYHNFINALCAVCVGNYFGIDEHLINDAISEYIPDKNRMQWIISNKQNKIILDAYNANPTSMMAALEFFREKQILSDTIIVKSNGETLNTLIKNQDKILILGDMFELGEYSEKEHFDILKWVKENFSQSVVYGIGKEFCKAAKQLGIFNPLYFFETTSDFLEYLSTQNIFGKFILIKASRGMQLEKTLQYL